MPHLSFRAQPRNLKRPSHKHIQPTANPPSTPSYRGHPVPMPHLSFRAQPRNLKRPSHKHIQPTGNPPSTPSYRGHPVPMGRGCLSERPIWTTPNRQATPPFSSPRSAGPWPLWSPCWQQLPSSHALARRQRRPPPKPRPPHRRTNGHRLAGPTPTAFATATAKPEEEPQPPLEIPDRGYNSVGSPDARSRCSTSPTSPEGTAGPGTAARLPRYVRRMSKTGWSGSSLSTTPS